MEAAPFNGTVLSSITSNPSVANEGLTTGTTDWLWAVFAIMLTSSIVFIGLSFMRPLGTRVFHQIPAMILMTASIAYFCMASNLGGTPIPVEYTHAGTGTRAIWYVRYIDWTITTPLLLLELLLATGLPLSDIVTIIFFDLVMIITGLVGSLVSSAYKWAFFTGGMVALFYIWTAFIGARKSAHAISPAAGRAFTGSAIYLSLIWLLYPVAWGLADGGNVLHPSGEMIFYGILDVLAKPVFCFWHIMQLRKVPYESYALSSGKVSSGHNAVGAGALGAAAGAAATHHHEKQPLTSGVANGHNGVVNGNGVADGHNHHHGAADAAAGAAVGATAEHHHDHSHTGADIPNGSVSFAPGYDSAAHDSTVTGARLA